MDSFKQCWRWIIQYFGFAPSLNPPSIPLVPFPLKWWIYYSFYSLLSHLTYLTFPFRREPPFYALKSFLINRVELFDERLLDVKATGQVFFGEWIEFAYFARGKNAGYPLPRNLLGLFCVMIEPSKRCWYVCSISPDQQIDGHSRLIGSSWSIPLLLVVSQSLCHVFISILLWQNN